MLFDKLTKLAQSRAQSRVASPVIISAKTGRLNSLMKELKQIDLSEEFRDSEALLPRLRDVIPTPTALGKSFVKLNMATAFLSRDGIFDLAQDPNVDRIYSDEIKFAFNENPPGSFMFQNKLITSTFFTRKLIGAQKAGERGYTGKNVHVSVIDTGASRSHEALIQNVETRTTLPQARDANGHGTWCTACVGGKMTIDDITSREVGEKIPTEGVATGTKLLAIKALGFGIGMGTDSSILGAIEIALENNSDIISMSLGGTVSEETEIIEDDVYSEAMDKAHEQNAIPIVAAGNDGANGAKTIATPGWLDNVFTVGAYSSLDGKIADFSSRGPTVDGRIKPDAVAPGVNINAPLVGALDKSDKRIQRYGAISGTSMATPHVSGLVALMQQSKRELLGQPLTLDELFSMMEAFGDEKNNISGWGEITWDKIWVPWMSSEYGVNI